MFLTSYLPTYQWLVGKIDSAICKSNEKFISLSIQHSLRLSTTRVYSFVVEILPVGKDYLNFLLHLSTTTTHGTTRWSVFYLIESLSLLLTLSLIIENFVDFQTKDLLQWIIKNERERKRERENDFLITIKDSLRKSCWH